MSAEILKLTKELKEILDIKNTVTEMRNVFNALTETLTKDREQTGR